MSTGFDIHRLRRKSWNNDVDGLAQEMHAILATFFTEGFKGPLRIVTEGNEPPIIMNLPEDFVGTPIQITKGPDDFGIPFFPTNFTPPPPPGYDPLDVDGPGNVPPNDPFSDDVPIEPVDTPANAGSPTPDGDDSGGTIVGVVPVFMPVATMAKVISGTGKDYVVGIWLRDPGDSLANTVYMEVAARAATLHDDEGLDADTVVPCYLYYEEDDDLDNQYGVKVHLLPPTWM